MTKEKIQMLDKLVLSDDERELFEYYILKDTPNKKIVNAGKRGQHYYCGVCGKQVSDDHIFCYQCGQRLISEKDIVSRLIPNLTYNFDFDENGMIKEVKE